LLASAWKSQRSKTFVSVHKFPFCEVSPNPGISEFWAAGVYIHMRTGFATLVVSYVFLTFARPTWGGEQATLMVTTEGQRSTYQIGERIPIDLSFTGPGNKQFEITMSSYDRSGRMAYEQFDVEPNSGWSDPLAIYFGSQRSFMSGGLSSLGVLSPTPTVMHLNLNEWIRFDQPGSYTVVVTSHRVGDSLDANRTISHPSDLLLKSNPIHLKIVPANNTWQRAKLASIIDELSTHPAVAGIQSPAREAPVADLRYLGTPQAAQVMAQHLRDDEPTMMYQCAFGLIGLPETVRSKAIAAMDKLILDPDFPVSSWFLITLPVLQIVAQEPVRQQTERVQLSEATWESVLEALPAKRGSARAATVQTLLGSHPKEMTEQMKLELGSILRDNLNDLPADKQVSELRFDWDQIGSPSLLPTLQQLAKQPLKDPGSNLSTVYTTRELKSIALERWYQLDPDGAREEAIRQIGSPHPSMTAESLYFLEKESLPQFEGIWAEAFMAATDYQQETVFASLLAHYGTGSAVATVRQKAEEKTGEWACATQGAALGYLVEFDPASARPLVERAVQARGPGKTACNHSIFQDIAHYSQDPMLREIAIRTLDDPDPEVTMDALIYLMSYGDASDEEPISNRYTKWSQKWRGRSDELDARNAGSPAGNWQEIGLGEDLARALIANQGWLASEKLIQNTIEKCVGEQMCQQLNQLAKRAQTTPYLISVYKQGENENYEIAQYGAKSLKLLGAKIAQFPKGSRFIMTNGIPKSEEQKKLDGSVRALLEQHGMVAERDPH
jgi:hypothetical protein